MPTPQYEWYKGDHQYIDEIETLTVYPIGDSGESPSDALSISNVKAHRGDERHRGHAPTGAAVATDPHLQTWIIFVETLAIGADTYEIASGVEFVTADGTRWHVSSARLAVFGTRWIAQATKQPVVAI